MFEYKVDIKREISVSDLGGAREAEYLKEMDEEGWEFITVIDKGFGNAYIYYWKRKKINLQL